MPVATVFADTQGRDGRALQMLQVEESPLNFMRQYEYKPPEPVQDVVVKFAYTMKFFPLIFNVDTWELPPPSLFWVLVTAVGDTLARLCKTTRPVFERVLQDLDSFGEPRVVVDIDYMILPQPGGEHYCADQVAIAIWGRREAPFNPGMTPPLRSMIRWTFDQNEDLKEISIADWYIGGRTPECVSASVFAPINLVPADAYEIPPGSLCGGNPEVPEPGSTMAVVAKGWVDPPEISVDPNACERSAAACTCAAKDNCAWNRSATASGGRCSAVSNSTSVACKDCSEQSKCPTSKATTCGLQSTPCDCAWAECELTEEEGALRRRTGSVKKWRVGTFEKPKPPCCLWQAADWLCVSRDDVADALDGTVAGITSCADCAEQYFCEPPRVAGNVQPHSWRGLATLPSARYGSQINITFNRIIEVSSTADVALHCDESEYDPNPSTLKTIEVIQILHTNLAMDSSGYSLIIQLAGPRNEWARECGLVIGSGSVVDLNGVAYLGLEPGGYQFMWGDTVGPVVTTFDPANLARGVQVDKTIYVNFDENIYRAADPTKARMQIVALGAGSNSSSSDSRADVIVADLGLDSPQVTFAASSVEIRLVPELKPGKFYSVVLPIGCLTDVARNVFVGLEKGAYTFLTEQHNTAESPDPAESNTILVVVLMVLSVLVFIAIVIRFARWYQRRSARFEVRMKELKKPSRFGLSSLSSSFGFKWKAFDMTWASWSSEAKKGFSEPTNDFWVEETHVKEVKTSAWELKNGLPRPYHEPRSREAFSGRHMSYRDPQPELAQPGPPAKARSAWAPSGQARPFREPRPAWVPVSTDGSVWAPVSEIRSYHGAAVGFGGGEHDFQGAAGGFAGGGHTVEVLQQHFQGAADGFDKVGFAGEQQFQDAGGFVREQQSLDARQRQPREMRPSEIKMKQHLARVAKVKARQQMAASATVPGQVLEPD